MKPTTDELIEYFREIHGLQRKRDIPELEYLLGRLQGRLDVLEEWRDIEISVNNLEDADTLEGEIKKIKEVLGK